MYSSKEQLNIAKTGLMMWEDIASFSSFMLNICQVKECEYTLRELKEKTYHRIKNTSPAKLTSFCSGCTIYIRGNECYKRCRVAKQCKLYQESSDSKDYKTIFRVAKAMRLEHIKWIDELTKATILGCELSSK